MDAINFIYIKQNCLDLDTCEEIINVFNNETQLKDYRLQLSFDVSQDDKFIKIKTILKETLIFNFKKYFSNLSVNSNNCDSSNACNNYYRLLNNINENNFNKKFKFFVVKLMNKNFNNENKYSYENIHINDKAASFSFIFFLNTIEYGGEVEIMDKYNIFAEKGKLLIFPTSWTFPYKHFNVLKNQDKYIIKGYLFIN
jgi:hypothetical protein